MVLRSRKKKRLNRSKAGTIFLTFILILFGLFSIWPLVFTVCNAFKPLSEIFIFPPKLWVQNPTWDNFADLGQIMRSSWVPFSRYMFNTLIITVGGTIGHVLLASMAAYPLAKHKMPGHKLLFSMIVLSLMFSNRVTGIPNYIVMSKIGLVDQYAALILPAFAYPLGLYLMKQFMEQIPDSLIESGKIDGASEYRIYWQLIMPLVKPAWLTLIILVFQQLWGSTGDQFLYSEQLKPLSYIFGQIVLGGKGGVARSGVVAAAALIMIMIPMILFVLSQSRVIETMSTSGMKE
ncbi:carbohydrate ABC transporter permease [Vallitalea pronyensis]|uniref:carbohydrate ABC transporter permease n=1 Tax=Vallitalea pronyensis TaxID=1348613 RepID=UPI001FEA1E39|nr:carbohydrate ABC transporter permease [Vallitalea pronyensis]